MEKFKRGLGLVLIIVGVGIILNIAYKKFETAQRQKEILEVFQSQVVDKDSVESGDEDETTLSANGFTPIAILKIPTIDLSQVIVEGIEDSAIQYYLGHFPESAMPGTGNFAVAGHRVSSYTDAFINLYKVKEGDELIVETFDKRYIYEVTDKFIVSPDEVNVLNQTEDPTITLVTCTVSSAERVIVTGDLISEETLSN